MRVYATEADYEVWVGADESGATVTVPADIDRQLARASLDVEQATLTAVYQVDSDGFPTVAAVEDALRDATCAQVEWWQSTGDELGTGGGYDDVQIGSVRLARRQPATLANGPTPGALAPRAVTILTLAGLIGQGVQTPAAVLDYYERPYG